MYNREQLHMFFTVDYDTCNQDGLCVLVCPAKIIELHNRGPAVVAGGEEICIKCGHCVAVCPEAALKLDFLTPESCSPIDPAFHLNETQADHFLRSRRSIRSYRQKPVPRDVLERALSIASSAPSGSNRQPVKWLVVYSKSDVQAVAAHVIDWMRHVFANHPDVAATFRMEALITAWEDGVDRICREAPHLIFAYASKEIGSAPADCHTAIAYLELALPSFGLGSCWAGYINAGVNQWPPLAEFLHVPDGHQIQGAVMVGQPKLKYKRIPARNPPDITYK